MFDFIYDMGNYEERRVATYNINGVFVDTARVSDGDKTYETAVEHADYNGGKMVIVEAYDNLAEAQAGHQKWVDMMTSEELPEYLQDCQNSAISQWLPTEKMRFPRRKGQSA